MKSLFREVLLTALIFSCVMLSGADKAAEKIDPQLLIKARSGDAQAQLETGFAFFQQGNPVRAAYWFHAAAAQNLPAALYNLGRCYLDGYGVPKNHHLAEEYLKKAAAANIQPAKLLLARLYITGIAADPDHKPPLPAKEPDEAQAIKLLDELIKLDSDQAYLMYAGFLIRKARQEDHNRIVEFLQKAIKLGNIDAMSMLADYFLSAPGERRDEKAARRLLTKAAPHSAAAMAKLAFMTEQGFGAPPAIDQAFELYKKSIEKKFTPLAAVRLANYYMTGRGGAPLDIFQAFKLYKKAAEQGNWEAMCRLGECYLNGLGTEKDPAQAFECFFQAAQADFAEAQYQTGQCFDQGSGTATDKEAAFYWYRQSAMRNDPRGMLETGRCYLEGIGTAQDAVRAAAFLEQAVARGMRDAVPLLEKARRMPEKVELPKAQKIPEFQFRITPEAGKN